jgi:hypothetical protein
VAQLNTEAPQHNQRDDSLRKLSPAQLLVERFLAFLPLIRLAVIHGQPRKVDQFLAGDRIHRLMASFGDEPNRGWVGKDME